jgi:hypothetical protein
MFEWDAKLKVQSLLLVGLLSTLTGSARADIVVPNELTSVSGLGGPSSPIIGPGGWHEQYLIEPTELTGLPVGSQIGGIAFRANHSNTISDPTINAGFSRFDVTLAQAATTSATMSGNFAANMANPVLVESGPLSVPAHSFGIGSDPNAFYQLLTFTTPYTYQGGGLIVDTAFVNTNFTVHQGGFDGTTASDNTVHFPGRILFASGDSATTGDVLDPFDTDFPTMKFITVPAPGSTAIVALGGAVFWRRRRPSNNR